MGPARRAEDATPLPLDYPPRQANVSQIQRRIAVSSLGRSALLEHPPVIAKILIHLGLPARAPSRAAASAFDRIQLA